MNEKLSRCFYALCVGFLFLPFLIFLFGWGRAEISVPLGVSSTAALLFWFRKTTFPVIPFAENRRVIQGALLLAVFWTAASGVGGYAYQNYDHYYRNAVLLDLIRYDWPVIHDGEALVYYFGFYLLPALGAKTAVFLGLSFRYAFEIAEFLCFAQALFAVFGTYLLLSLKLRRFSLWTMIFFIEFSGLDVIPYLMYYRPAVDGPEITGTTAKLGAFFGLSHAPHLEWYTMPWLNSSMTGQLFWVYNQSVPFWLGMLLLLTLPDRRALLFLYALLFLTSPFPAVGLFPLILWQMFPNKDEKFSPYEIVRNLASCLNLFSIFVVLFIAVFYRGNVSAGITRFVFPENAAQWGTFGVYFVTEFLIWLVFLGRKWDVPLGILFGVVLASSFFKLGGGSDFAMRAAIPFFLYLMFRLLQRSFEMRNSRAFQTAFIAVFLVGCAVPLMEFKRCAGNTAMTLLRPENPDYYIRDERLSSVFDLQKLGDPCWRNFCGKTDERFFRKEK